MNKLWKGCFAKPTKDLRLSFENTLQVITNSLPIDEKTVVIHQYEFQINRMVAKFSLNGDGANIGEIVTDEYERKMVYYKLRYSFIRTLKTYIFVINCNKM